MAFTIYTNVTPPYRHLADVYELFVPEAMRTPQGSAAAFAGLVAGRVLDCACGIGLLAVGLALAGHETHASDLSPEMIVRTRSLAAAHGVHVHARVCAWADLEASADFDTVLCVGNSLAHARDRRAALRAMAGTLRAGGTLVLTSRNWERERAAGSRTETEGAVTRTWTIPPEWDAPHTLEVSAGGAREVLTVFPFTFATLAADLRAAGFEVAMSTASDAERYLVTASRVR